MRVAQARGTPGRRSVDLVARELALQLLPLLRGKAGADLPGILVAALAVGHRQQERAARADPRRRGAADRKRTAARRPAPAGSARSATRPPRRARQPPRR